MKRNILVAVVLITFISLSVSHAYEREIRTVEGLIESVSGDSIRVRGSYYHFNDVPLIDPSGKHIPKSQMKVGRKVEIFLQKKGVGTILIYPEYMLE